jgi:hypothetical protein
VFPGDPGFSEEEKTMHSGRLILVLVTLFFGAPAASHAYEKEVLRGLKGVCVAVAPISPEIEKLGLAAAELQKDVEVKLRQAGIKVLRPKELYQEEGCSGLMIRVNGSVFRVKQTSMAAYAVHLGVMELVQLKRPTLVPIIPAQTWGYDSEGVQVVKASQVNHIAKAVEALVDKFIRDYRAANPQ